MASVPWSSLCGGATKGNNFQYARREFLCVGQLKCSRGRGLYALLTCKSFTDRSTQRPQIIKLRLEARFPKTLRVGRLERLDLRAQPRHRL